MTNQNFRVIHFRLLPAVAFLLLFVFGHLQTNGKSSAKGLLSPVLLRCENLVNPSGVDILQPQLSWQLTSLSRNQTQSAYRIFVADSEENLKAETGNYWDTGKISSSQTNNIPYRGKLPASGQRLYWKVCVWDPSGNAYMWSAPARWEMGYQSASDWKAKWIGTGENPFPDSVLTYPAPYFRKVVRNRDMIKSAVVRISGLGFYELTINGKKAGDQVLAPAQTNYDSRKLQMLIYFHDDQSRQRVLYNTLDVKDLLVNGDNVIGVVLGNGWYNQRDRTEEGRMWYDTPRLFFQLEIVSVDGSKQLICSDETWKVTTGPLLHDGIFTGEWYDARLELGDWQKPEYDASSWKNAAIVRAPVGKLYSQLAPPDRIIRTIRPKLISQPKDKTWLFDAGEMISGWVQLKIEGKRGDTIRIRHIEELGRDYRQIDTYILKGTGQEVYEPRFTWHAFRQVEVSGASAPVKAEDLLVKVVHTDVASAGNFECSNELFNKIYQNYLRTQLGNLHGSISSDCPHRERLGYTGDGQVAVESAILNFDLTRFYQKWFLDMEDARNHKTGYVPHTVPFGGGGGGPAWGSGYVIMPWYYYLYYGDKQVLETHYDGMKMWVDYLGTRCDIPGIVVREEPKGWCLGDWATPVKIALSPSLVNSCYYYYVSKLFSEIAGALGKTRDQEKYEQLSGEIRKAINRQFYNPGTGNYLDGKQGANVFPLAFGITPEEEQNKVYANLLKLLESNGNHFDTGILGTPLLLKVLTHYGRSDLAYTLMNQRDFPSFGDPIVNQATTTLWENWNGKSSHSHPMYGSVVAWFFNTLAGISPDPVSPGMQHFVIQPEILKELTIAKASYQSIFGQIRSEWRKSNDQLQMEVEIPVNTTATVYFPTENRSDIKENGKSISFSGEIQFLKSEHGKSIFRIGSGTYHFVVKLKDE